MLRPDIRSRYLIGGANRISPMTKGGTRRIARSPRKVRTLREPSAATAAQPAMKKNSGMRQICRKTVMTSKAPSSTAFLM